MDIESTYRYIAIGGAQNISEKITKWTIHKNGYSRVEKTEKIKKID